MHARDLQNFPHPATLGFLFILVLSSFTIFHQYAHPPHFFWDENYHIASAQKYLNGVFFMEPHPPLGKMLIALGEKLLNRNALDDQFIGTDYAKDPPPDFSFAGYRFFPVLLAWLTAPILFCIFFVLTRRSLWAVFLSFLYVFDNAMIVHLRGAMLEGPLLFFSSLTILAFLLLLEQRDDPKRFARAALFFGVAFAGMMLTKVFGLILILLVPSLFLLLWNRKLFLRFLGWAALGFLPLYIGIWQLHFALASRINPVLPDNGFYQASEEYKQILAEGRNASLLSLPVMLRDSLTFIGHYEEGVPRLDLCKSDENGSPWFLWPVGGRAINYRWETSLGQTYKYLYLQVNPAVWLLGFLGVLLSAALLLCSAIAPPVSPLERRGLVLTFFTLYVAYLAGISTIDRVMYLYHYFLPLLLSFLLLTLVILEVRCIGRLRLGPNEKTLGLLILGLLVFLSYQFYRPLTYYEPMTDKQVERRALLKIWELRCVRCPPASPFVEKLST